MRSFRFLDQGRRASKAAAAHPFINAPPPCTNATKMAKVNVSGKVRSFAAEADTSLLWVIRESTGHAGCGHDWNKRIRSRTKKLKVIDNAAPIAEYPINEPVQFSR
jgi:hypothetical protein